MDLQGKVAIVTGGSLGIGRAIALDLATHGADVAINYRKHAAEANAVVGDMERIGRRGLAVQADVASFDDALRMVDTVREKLGRLDILVNNAGLGHFGRLESMPVEEARYLFDVNVMGTLYGIQAVVPIMRAQRSGHIINVASVVGKRASPGSGFYSATKCAQVALSEALRLELADTGIDVSVICPVSTMTEFFEVAASRSPLKFDPVGPRYSAEQVAGVILGCVRRPRLEVMVYPPARLMVILNAVAPRLMDRILGQYWKKVRPGL